MTQIIWAVVGLEVVRKVSQMGPLIAGFDTQEGGTFCSGAVFTIFMEECFVSKVHCLLSVRFTNITTHLIIYFMASESSSALVDRG